MKKFISPSFLNLLVIISLLAVARADYPIVSHRYLADPGILVHEGRVYIYCSNDDENPMENPRYMMQSLVCVSSSDMKNWTDHGVVFRVPDNASWAERSWAPAVAARNGKFYLYFADSGKGIGVAVGPSPTGPFSDPVNDYLVGWNTPGAAGENMWMFDPYVFVDDDGQAYLYFGGNGEDNIRVIKLNEDMISVAGPAVALHAKGFFEASWMHKKDGIYYFSYSTNPAHGLRIDYMTSDSPDSGFVYQGIVAGQPPFNDNGNNHAGEFEFKEKWYHVYHNRAVATRAGIPTSHHRNLGIEELFFAEDGSIKSVEYTVDGVTQLAPFNPYVKSEAETFADQSGVEVKVDQEKGMVLSDLSNGDWIHVQGVDFAEGASKFSAHGINVDEGIIELRLGSPEGRLIGSLIVNPAAGENSKTWRTMTCPVNTEGAEGPQDLFLKFVSQGEADFLQVDWWCFKK